MQRLVIWHLTKGAQTVGMYQSEEHARRMVEKYGLDPFEVSILPHVLNYGLDEGDVD